MSALRTGDPVLLRRGYTSHVGTVREPTTIGGEHGHVIDVLGGDPWFATPDALTPLPHGAPLLRLGDRARIDIGAPHFPGIAGQAAGPQFQDRMFGYWMHLDGVADLAWIPAAALTPETPLTGATPEGDTP